MNQKSPQITSDKQFLRKVGRKIGEIRLQRALTQSQLAEKAQVSIQMVQYWESGRNITLKTLYNLARHLESPVHHFLAEPKTLTAQRGRPRSLHSNNGKKRTKK